MDWPVSPCATGTLRGVVGRAWKPDNVHGDSLGNVLFGKFLMTLIPAATAVLMMSLGQTSGASGSAKTAVVNVAVVSEKYQRTKDLETQFDQRRQAFNQQRDQIKQRIERTQQSLQEEFKPGTPEYDERLKQLALLEAEMKFFVEAEGQKIEQGLAGSLRSIYNDIVAAIKEVADAKGIDVVLAADQVPAEPPINTQQARQQIVLQKVLYWTPKVDLTEEVSARLNERYKAQPSLTLEGTIQPAKGTEPPPKGGAKP